MVEIIVRTILNPTESLEKIEAAIKNILPNPEIKTEQLGEITYVISRASGKDSLSLLHRLLHEQRILEAARKIMKSTIMHNEPFYLNKQAALMGKISFCSVEGESPLGPIEVTIEAEDMEKLIDWLTPKTINGKPISKKTKAPT